MAEVDSGVRGDVALLRAALEAIPGPAAVLDHRGAVHLANPSWTGLPDAAPVHELLRRVLGRETDGGSADGVRIVAVEVAGQRGALVTATADVGIRSLLELVARGTPLDEVLDAVAAAGEAQLPGSTWVVLASPTTGWGAHLVTTGVPAGELDGVEEAYRSLAPSRWIGPDRVRVVPPDGMIARALGLAGAWSSPVILDDDLVRGFVLVRHPGAVLGPYERHLLDELVSVVRLAIQRDTTNRRLAGRLLEDALTGLPARSLFHRHVEQSIAQLGAGPGIALVSADLDRFARINESLGHAAGDQVLVELARRLRERVPGLDAVARGGGDEFLVLLEDVASEADALALAEELAAILRRPVRIGDTDVPCSASVGVVLCTEADSAGHSAGALESDAAVAMATAKARGRDRVHLYTPSLRSPVAPLDLERDLLRAVGTGQFVVHYQPEIEVSTNRVVGIESLVRWEHPVHGTLLPAAFVDTAEETGVIVEIGHLVVADACARLAEWSALTGDDSLTISVNLSARQLADPGLIDFAAAQLACHDLSPHRLVLEVTEDTLVTDPERATNAFHALRELGVQVTIDDFGTGYSSLRYLKEFPADRLKIDRLFVTGLGDDAGDSAIVAAVVRLSHRLDLTVIAEGVETPQQLAHLRRLGCEQAQGFLWTKPLRADELTDLLRRPLPPVPDVPVAALEPGLSDGPELDELLAVLTHELSTPLTVIGGYAEMLASRVDDAGARSGVAAIERNVHNLGRMVAALADARGLDHAVETVRIDAGAFVAQLLDDLEPILAGHEVTRVLDERAVVDADPVGLRQILTNLVGNAVKFSSSGGPIDVTLSTDDGSACIAVVDHGAGVPPDRTGELFGRFSRLGSTRKGLGLGLYIARSTARRLGGDVNHEPTPGGGATFVVTLPLASEES